MSRDVFRVCQNPRPLSRGFTLIEVIMAITIVSMLFALVYGSFAQTVRTKDRVEEIGQRYHQLRLAMDRMAREISMAYLSQNNPIGTTVPNTMFEGKRERGLDTMTFSAYAHQPLRENAKECDQTLISYYGADDPDERDVKNIMRRATRRLGTEKPGEEGPAYVLLENVKNLKFRYWDQQAQDWRDDWNTRTADGQPDRLPAKVEISLTVEDTNGEDLTLITATRTFMRDALWFQPK